jgi:hypothetical protein
LWKVIRSIKPEISSVAGVRSGIAAFIGDSFSHGRLGLAYHGDCAGRSGRGGFPFQADCDQHHFRHSDTRHSIDRMVHHRCVRDGLVPTEFGAGRKGAFL